MPYDRIVAIARLGRSALRTGVLAPLFEEALETLRQVLDVELAKILELQPGGESLLLTAGAGWPPGLVGSAAVSSGCGSQAGYTLGRRGAVVVENLAEDERFQGPPLLTENGVVSGMSVIIGSDRDPWGVLGVHSRQHRAFTPDDVHFLEAVANILSEAIGRVRNEGELRDREHRLQLVTDAIPVLIAYCDRGEVYRYCNARYTEWFGLGQEEVVGRTVAELVGPEAYATVEAPIGRVLSGEPVSFEAHLPYRHGPPRDVQVDYMPHRSAGGEVVGFYAMIVDISERVRAEAPRAWLASIVEHSHDAIIGKDLDGRITSWNAAAERMYGYRPEEVVGRSIDLLFPDDHKDELDSILATIRRGEAVHARETIRVRKDGQRVEVIVTVSPIRGPGGQLLGASAVAHDLSVFRRAERAMRESEERLHVATEAAEIGIFDWDISRNEIRWDNRTRSIWGVAEDEDVDYERFLAGVEAEDLAALGAAVDRSLDPCGGGRFHAEYRVRNDRDGIVRWIAATGQVSFVAEHPQRMVGTVQDISAHKRAERQREEWAERLATQLELTRKTERELRRSNRDLEEFTGIVTHDLINPLGSAMFTVELMRESLSSGDSAPLEKQVEVLHGALRQMDQLVKELHSQAMSRRNDEELEDIALDAVLADARRNTSHLIGEHGARVEVDGGLPTVRGNPVLLVQLFTNLIDNAVKYRADEVPLIRIESADDPDWHLLRVADNGRGVQPEDREKIFQPATRGSNASGTPGSGLGLAFCRRIMESHDGTISVTDGSDPGTTFELRFPR